MSETYFSLSPFHATDFFLTPWQQKTSRGIFYMTFGCPTADVGPLSRGQPYSSDVNHFALTIFNLCPLWTGCWIAILKTFFKDFCWLVVSLSFFIGLGALDTFLWFGIRLSFQLWLFFTGSSTVCRNYLSASPLSFLLILNLNI